MAFGDRKIKNRWLNEKIDNKLQKIRNKIQK
jgi:hypothetical protein